VQIRLEIAQGGTSLAERTSTVDRSNALQEALWQQAKAMASIDKGPVPTGLFIQSLNEMIDDQGKRLSVLRNRIPNSVFVTLFGIVAVAGAFASYGSARDVERTRLPVYVMVLLISAVIFLIMDLDRPSAGFITNSQQPMIDLAASMASFSD
jgi:Na+/glutamate symporter